MAGRSTAALPTPAPAAPASQASFEGPLSYSATAKSGSGRPPEDHTGNDDGFLPARKKHGRLRVASRLKGAKSVKCKAFHLAGISPDSAVEDVITHCRLKGVAATGCYPVRTRAWGTQSMKLFVDAAAEASVLQEDFWPAHVRCTLWLKKPPQSKAVAPPGDDLWHL